MAARSRFALAAKTALLPIALLIGVASFIHAASETEAFSSEIGVFHQLGLDAHMVGTLVDNGFKSETVARQQEGQREFPRLSAPLLSLARTSFAIDPLEVPSLRAIALGGVLHDDPERARRVMRLAERFSRRDSITNLWLAQDYLRANNVEAMLASFDHALRTSTRVREYAIKPVVETLASEESYAPLGQLLATKPEWEDAFWNEFVRNPVGQAQAVPFLEANGISLDRIPQSLRRRLYLSLKNTQQYDTLFGLAALDRNMTADINALSAGKFVSEDGDNPLGWALHSEGNFAARIHESTNELQIDARAGSFGLAADRAIRGGQEYRLALRMAEPLPDGTTLELSVRCAEGEGRILADVTLASGAGSNEAEFSAIDCGFASLNLSFSVDPGRRDTLIRVAAIELQAM